MRNDLKSRKYTYNSKIYRATNKRKKNNTRFYARRDIGQNKSNLSELSLILEFLHTL